MKYFGGIEGGATRSQLVIVNEKGDQVALIQGPGTNHWTIGIPEVVVRINDMVTRGKQQATIPIDEPLTSLGLALSGCEQEATNRDLEAALQVAYPNISKSYYVCSDTVGSLLTASPNGGIVIIAGTGSNGYLRNPNGTEHTCGGWGHYIGDEGSAWRIAFRALKITFDHMDGFRQSPYPVDVVWNVIKDVYKVETRLDLLPHCYAQFNKTLFASICKRLSETARAGDLLSRYVFKEAGQDLARIIQALLPHIHKDLVKFNNVNIVCVGAVWQSFDLLREGFYEQLRKTTIPYDLSLVTITKAIAYGACYVGADAIKFPLPRNYADNFKVKTKVKQHSATDASEDLKCHSSDEACACEVNGQKLNGIKLD